MNIITFRPNNVSNNDNNIIPKHNNLLVTERQRQAIQKIWARWKIYRSFKRVKEYSNITIPKQARENRVNLFARIYTVAGLLEAEQKRITKCKKDHELLTDEEQELFENIVNGKWTLKHTTNSLKEIQQNGNILRSLTERRRRGEEINNAHTASSDGNDDNVFFSCGLREHSTPNFLNGASDIIYVDINGLQKKSPELLSGLWTSGHFFAYRSNQQSKVISLGTTKYYVQYHTVKSPITEEKKHIKSHIFARNNGSILKLSIEMGQEIGLGANIPEETALRLIEFIRLAGPEFREHILNNRHDVDIIENVMNIFFHPGIFEAHIPAEFPLDDMENIHIEHRVEFSYEDRNEQTIKLCNAVLQQDYQLIQELIDSGLDINRVYQTSCNDYLPLALAVKNKDEEMVKFLMTLGADPNTKYYSFDLKSYRTPLVEAISRKMNSIINLFIEEGVPSGKDPMIRHISMVTDDCLQSAIDIDVPLNIFQYLFANLICSKEQKEEALNHSLIVAFKSNNLDIINFCLDSGADINFRSKTDSFFKFKHDGLTPLITAIVMSNLNLVKLALGIGADTNKPLLHDGEVVREFEGFTPLMITIKEIETYEKNLQNTWLSDEDKIELMDNLTSLNMIFTVLLSQNPCLTHKSTTGETAFTLAKNTKELYELLQTHAKSKKIKPPKKVKSKISINDARKHYGYAFLTGVDQDGDIVVFLRKSVNLDGVTRLHFPNSMQKYSSEKSLLQTSLRAASESLNVNIDALSLRSSSEDLQARINKINQNTRNSHFDVKAQIHHFEINQEMLPKAKNGFWVKVKDIDKEKVIDRCHNRFEYICRYKGDLISAVASQFIRGLEETIKTKDVYRAFLYEFFGYQYLLDAIRKDDKRLLSSLLSIGIDPNIRGLNENQKDVFLHLSSREIPFYEACRTEKIDLAKLLIDSGLKVNELPKLRLSGQNYGSWNSLIHLAVDKQNIKLLKFLKEIEFYEYSEKEYINSALKSAARKNSIEIVQFLIDIGANTTQQALANAYDCAQTENFKLLLQHMDPEFRLDNIIENIYWDQPLHQIVQKSFLFRNIIHNNSNLAASSMLLCFLENGFKANVKDKKERSALSHMICLNRAPTKDTYACTKILLMHGSNPFERVSFKNKRQINLYEYVLQKKDQQYIDIFNNFLEGSSIFQLYNAVKNRHSNTIDQLLQEACDDGAFAEQVTGAWFMVHVRDKEGITPLQRACEVGNIDVVKLLLNHKCINIDEVDRYGRSPLSRAAENNHDEIINLLLSRGADPSLCRKKTPAPLLIATENESVSTVKTLLSWGADTNATNQFEKKAIDIALEKKHAEIIEVLLCPPKIISRVPNIDEVLKPVSQDVEEKFISYYNDFSVFHISDFIRFLSYTYPTLNEIFESSARVREGYSIREHTLRVGKIFDRQFYLHKKTLQKQESSKSSIDTLFMLYPRIYPLLRVSVALHDIGKPLGPKSEQHINTLPILRGVLHKLGFSENDFQLAKAIVSHDIIGEFVRPRFNKTIEETKNQLIELANETGLEPKLFYHLLKVFYISDASSYPKVMKHYMIVDKKERIHPKSDKLLELEKSL